MDPLDTMLNDPLDLGSGVDNHRAPIMEECLLGGTRVNLPEDLLEDPELFFDVVSLDTWKNVLSDSQREHLRQFLPSFPEDNTRQQQYGHSTGGCRVVRPLYRRRDGCFFDDPSWQDHNLHRRQGEHHSV